MSELISEQSVNANQFIDTSLFLLKNKLILIFFTFRFLHKADDNFFIFLKPISNLYLISYIGILRES